MANKLTEQQESSISTLAKRGTVTYSPDDGTDPLYVERAQRDAPYRRAWLIDPDGRGTATIVKTEGRSWT